MCVCAREKCAWVQNMSTTRPHISSSKMVVMMVTMHKRVHHTFTIVSAIVWNDAEYIIPLLTNYIISFMFMIWPTTKHCLKNEFTFYWGFVCSFAARNQVHLKYEFSKWQNKNKNKIVSFVRGALCKSQNSRKKLVLIFEISSMSPTKSGYLHMVRYTVDIVLSVHRWVDTLDRRHITRC